MTELATKLIRQQTERSQNREHAVPLYLTSSYTFDNADQMAALFAEEEEGYVYSRYANPNVTELSEKISTLENAEATWVTASGMAAVFVTFGALLQQGDGVISVRNIFGSTHQLFQSILPKWGIKTTYVDKDNIEKWEDAITPSSKILYLETPTNPGVDIIDLAAANAFAKKHQLIFVVDNCFATPINQQPILFGADLVIHSATKYFDGQGRVMGGSVSGSANYIKEIQGFARHTGPAISPFNAWVLSKSLETLPIRIEKHNQNALEIAKRLSQHEQVESVKYPFLSSHPQYQIAKKQMKGGGGIVTFEVRGGLEKGRQFLDVLKILSLTANLGDSRSIATHPASTTHSKLTPAERGAVGISDGLIRISVGLEHVEDIWQDITQALK